jgi:type I restriction enzyme S subunit
VAIVRFLDWANGRLERAIRSKRQVIALLNEQKQAIIHRAVTRGLDASVPLKPSGIPWLGDIPKHWEVSRSRRLFTVRKEPSGPDDVQLSSTQAYGVIPQAEFEERVGRRVVKISMHLEKRRHVERDDFVISMRSFQGGLERAWASGAIRSSYVVLKPESTVDVGYFSYLLKSPGYIAALQGTADFIRDGQDLTYGNFRRVDLPLIPLDEQRAIAAFISAATSGIYIKITRLGDELDLLREYRTRLVADVVTGKLDVREAAARLPEEGTPDNADDNSELIDDPESAYEEATV